MTSNSTTFVSELREANESHAPSYDQPIAGVSGSPYASVATTARSLPSEWIISSVLEPLKKAIQSPFGDQTGSEPATPRSRFRPPPADTISSLPFGSTKASRDPSGDQVG